MFSLTDKYNYWLYNQPTDMRKSFHSLSGIVQAQMHKSLTTEDVYIFINKTRNRIKLLHYERGGLVLYSKIIDQGRIKDLTSNTNGAVNWQTLLQAIESKKRFSFPMV